MKLCNRSGVQLPSCTSIAVRGGSMKGHCVALSTLILLLAVVVSGSPQDTRLDIKTGTLLKRSHENGVDNYPYAAYSFAFGGNGPDIQKRCQNNWDILFGNSPLP